MKTWRMFKPFPIYSPLIPNAMKTRVYLFAATLCIALTAFSCTKEPLVEPEVPASKSMVTPGFSISNPYIRLYVFANTPNDPPGDAGGTQIFKTVNGVQTNITSSCYIVPQFYSELENYITMSGASPMPSGTIKDGHRVYQCFSTTLSFYFANNGGFYMNYPYNYTTMQVDVYETNPAFNSSATFIGTVVLLVEKYYGNFPLPWPPGEIEP